MGPSGRQGGSTPGGPGGGTPGGPGGGAPGRAGAPPAASRGPDWRLRAGRLPAAGHSPLGPHPAPRRSRWGSRRHPSGVYRWGGFRSTDLGSFSRLAQRTKIRGRASQNCTSAIKAGEAPRGVTREARGRDQAAAVRGLDNPSFPRPWAEAVCVPLEA